MGETSRGHLFIISAPSGGGKTSLIKEVRAKSVRLTVSVSHTTRVRRASEIDGKDYYFVDPQTFNAMVERGDFVEHAEVFGAYYGTAKAFVENELSQGTDVVLEIDWQGAKQVRMHYQDAISIFILPPSKQVLQQRLESRGLDSRETIRFRMECAMAEMSHYNEYDYVIINDDFAEAAVMLAEIMIGQPSAETTRTSRRVGQVVRSLGLMW